MSLNDYPYGLSDKIGGAVDSLSLGIHSLQRKMSPRRAVTAEIYERELDYYFRSGFIKRADSFFSLPSGVPEYRVIEQKKYLDGRYQIICFPSRYKMNNPLLTKIYGKYIANNLAYLVRWTHGGNDRKTVLCLHGYMLGDPAQAEKMFRIESLFSAGLDVALFIAPFHWRRTGKSFNDRRLFLQPDNVGFTAEAVAQAVSDLEDSIAILKSRGGGDVGLIGASLGGYLAALYTALSRQHRFAALILPSLNFMKPEGEYLFRLPFEPGEALKEKIKIVWQMHSPLNFGPRLTENKILTVASRGDRICPFEYTAKLQEKWKLSRCHVMKGGHWLIFNRGIRGQAWYNFLQENDFIKGVGG